MPQARLHARTLFISDVHLGSKDCKAEFLLHLLKRIEVERLYLVGDIVDFWAMKKQMFWPAEHHQVLQQLLKMAKQGVEVIYIPGNHDEVMRKYRHPDVASIRIQKQAIHTTAKNQRLLVMHGDAFDAETCHSQWLSLIGDHLYDVVMFLNRQTHKLRKKFGHNYWSLAASVKSQVGKVEQVIGYYRAAAVREATKRKLDGIICGHIHRPEITQTNGKLYVNTGDWVENCTAILESADGELHLLRYTDAAMAKSTEEARTLNCSSEQQQHAT
ncbi:MAG TPA: UDP-2,3-diacylglucosamine diphosphatase [Pseudidiomarina sp.]|nr:UDP-2,3-diacylglucosamine diphosphatase [Pseudidiomarina sp.]